ncbi:MAG TPA: hypothetical protein VFJ74_11520 [Gemmatimonadaceae bacterium]|nr:hypothetical protein [Gemmatimonadaceae bacterium]
MSSNAHKGAGPSAAGGDSAVTAAFRDLEHLVRHLGEELAGFRRRALQAETRLKAAEAQTAEAVAAARAAAGDAPHPRVAELEAENERLRRRLDEATQRTRQMIDRVRFLRQQHHLGQGGEK